MRRTGSTVDLVELKAIRQEDVGSTRVVLLSRPHRRNAWTGRMHTEYRWALQQADEDPSVKAIVVTGDPEGRAFCVGADAAALEGHAERGGYDPGTPDDLPMPGYGVHPAFDADFAWHFGLAKPVVAGIGLVVACFADLRFAAAGSKLTTAYGKLGLPAEYGLSWLLPRMIGLGRANDLLLTSRVVLAEEARDLGLVNEVVSPDELLPRVHGWIEEFLGPVARSSLAAAKRQVYTDLHRDAASAIDEATRLLDVHTAGPDYAEGVAALTQRRPPNFP